MNRHKGITNETDFRQRHLSRQQTLWKERIPTASNCPQKLLHLPWQLSSTFAVPSPFPQTPTGTFQLTDLIEDAINLITYSHTHTHKHAPDHNHPFPTFLSTVRISFERFFLNWCLSHVSCCQEVIMTNVLPGKRLCQHCTPLSSPRPQSVLLSQAISF